MEWKRCSYPQWEEDYLTRQAPHVPEAIRVTPLAVVADLHEHHWQRERGGDCGDCGVDFLPFVMRCRGCNFASCWRCINNRI
jgi:hypothetical protein